MVKSLGNWRYYLEGCKALTVVTDHKPNTFLDSKPSTQLSRRQVGWQALLSRFDFQWEYRKGANNIADPLSRSPALMLNVVAHHEALLDSVKAAYAQASWMEEVQDMSHLEHHDGLWYFQGKVWIPNQADLRQKCISTHHDPPHRGHLGRDRTFEQVSRHCYWPTMRADVQRYVQHCGSCQGIKSATQVPAGLLMPLQIPAGLWESVSMDLITQLPKTKRGYTAIAVFVDRLSKMTHLVPVETSITSISAEGFAQVFLKEVFRHHGLPKSFVSDRGPRFTSAFLKSLCRSLGISQDISTAFHPQTDGQTERMDRVLGDMLRAYVKIHSYDDWVLLLPCCEFAINNSFQASIRNTAFFVNFGRHPRTSDNLAFPAAITHKQSKTDFVFALHGVWEEAKRCLRLAQERQGGYANKRRRLLEFQVGDFVLLDSKNLKLKSDGHRKLTARFLGPFEIVKKVGKVAYELKLTADMLMHDVFHVSLLRPYYFEGEGVPPAVLPTGVAET